MLIFKILFGFQILCVVLKLWKLNYFQLDFIFWPFDGGFLKILCIFRKMRDFPTIDRIFEDWTEFHPEMRGCSERLDVIDFDSIYFFIDWGHFKNEAVFVKRGSFANETGGFLEKPPVFIWNTPVFFLNPSGIYKWQGPFKKSPKRVMFRLYFGNGEQSL